MTHKRRALCTSVTIDPFFNLLFQLDTSYQWPAHMEYQPKQISIFYVLANITNMPNLVKRPTWD